MITRERLASKATEESIEYAKDGELMNALIMQTTAAMIEQGGEYEENLEVKMTLEAAAAAWCNAIGQAKQMIMDNLVEMRIEDIADETLI